ncbi:MAG: HD domain-containing phosphohydrolase [Pseudomonadota bacterium]
METPKILFVDDDENLLGALRRQLRGKFNLLTAVGGEQALKVLEDEGPIAICVADMRMPGMDGIKVLEEIGKRSPETVRMMLTGNADQTTAVEAINRGKIFRFFNKPYEDAALEAGLRDGLRQYQLITAERQLIEQTLAGSVKVLTEVLAQLNPVVFGRAMRVKKWCDMIVHEVGYPQPWELGLAALLCPIGLVSLPPDILARMAQDKTLQPLERDIVMRTPEVGRRLIANIPRLEQIAGIVHLQNRNFDGTGFPDGAAFGMEIPLGARILRILNDLGARVIGDAPMEHDFDELARHRHRYDPVLFDHLRSLLAFVDDGQEYEGPPEGREMIVLLKDLRVDDFLMTDIETVENRILLTHGQFISKLQLQRLRVFETLHKFREPIEIRRGARPPAPDEDRPAAGAEE